MFLQERFEWGPRALGHRSILADPRSAAMKDIVNTKSKFREPCRPFAPSILQELGKIKHRSWEDIIAIRSAPRRAGGARPSHLD